MGGLIPVKTLGLSVTRVAKHLKSLQLGCEATAAQGKRNNVTGPVLSFGTCQTEVITRSLVTSGDIQCRLPHRIRLLHYTSVAITAAVRRELTTASFGRRSNAMGE